MSEGETLLLVDDDAVFVDVLTRTLRRRGFEVVSANSVEQALPMLGNVSPHRAIVDLKMDGASGLELIPALRQRFANIRILVLTGYSSIATAVNAIKLGADNYLCKPATTAEILAAFDQAGGDPRQEIAPQPPSLERLEWEHIQKVLAENNGNVSATARQLGMHRRTLQRKLQKRPVRR